MRRTSQIGAVALAGAALLAAVVGCGGGGGGGTTPPPPPPTLLITTTALNDGVVGTAYSQTVAATGGTGARTFSISAGLPAGLMINASTGAITGTYTGMPGTFSFTVMVVDSGTPQQSDTQALTLDINDPLVITTMALPLATIGMLYNGVAAGFQIMATGGTPGTHAFSTTDVMPDGLTLNGAGVIMGTPTAGAINRTITVRVSDGSNPQQVDTQVLTIVVTLEITTTMLPNAMTGTVYSQTLQAGGGTPPYVSWMRTGGTMPSGIADPVAARGVISGTPNPVCSPTASNFTVQVSDSAAVPQSDSQALSITVDPGSAVDIVTTQMSSGVIGTPYSWPVQATGGVPPYSFAVTSGNLPSQLGITGGTGEVSGTPDTAETQNFTVTVTDNCGATDAQPLSMTINATDLGRNDTVATATPRSNGTFSATISPSGDPNSTFAPDVDVYEVVAAAGATVTVTVTGPGLNPPSPLDPVIELVTDDGTPDGQRLNTCRDPGNNSPPAPVIADATPNAFDDACINDDISLGVNRDSMLEFQNTTGGTLTFFVRVFDFRGDARPDLLYTITISGAQ